MSTPDKNKIADLILGYRQAKVLFVAVSMNLFELTDKDNVTVEFISKKLDTDLRVTEIFLNSLAAMGFLSKEAGKFKNTDLSGQCLVSGRPKYIGHNLMYQEILWEAWSSLPDTLRKGKPPKALRELMAGRTDFTRDYIFGMNEIAKVPAREIASIIDMKGETRLLDIGGGPGTFTFAFMERNPDLQGDILDLPGTLEVTERLVSQRPYRERIALIPADYHDVTLEPNAYDLILLSHVTHNEGEVESKELIRKSFSALRRGGRLIIHDFMVDETQTSPLFSAVLAMHMAVYTEKGQVYPVETYKQWLKEYGFEDIDEKDISPVYNNPTKIVVGRKL